MADLSGSLGGLRIANPDDIDQDTSPSPRQDLPRPLPPNSHSSTRTPTGSHGNMLPILPQDQSGQEFNLGFDPSSYSTPVTSDQSYGLATRRSIRDIQGSRPSSGIYNHQNTSSSSAVSKQSPYGYRNDLSTPDLARASSRSSRQPLGQASAHQVYRQPSLHANGANGPLPPRRNSRRSRAPESSPAAASSMPPTPEDWRERGAAVSTKTETDPSGQTIVRTVRKGVKDFTFGGTLGEGSYSTVVSATDRQTLKEYAIKVLDKRHIIKEKKVKYVNIERDTLNRLTDHPGIVRLYYTFQDERSLYFVLDLASGGELLGVLKKLGSFDVECTQFYAAQILDSIAYMHTRGVIHRDLKPENVLLDREMHVKITDFGTAKILHKVSRANSQGRDTAGELADTESDRAVSFVGTAEYVSPELLRDKSACKASDLWAFGCILFQLLAGRPPFKAANEYLTFQKILGLDYTFPTGFPEEARDLVERLLVLDPTARLTIEHIRNHRFFEGVSWGRELWRQKAPRLKAYSPPPAAPIKLNGGSTSDNIASAAAQQALSQVKPAVPRPRLRNISELPPPSQLDIDWNPIFVHANERILKLGNLVVFTAAQPYSPSSGKGVDLSTPNEKPKFARFFSGNTVKKRERLILITSQARLIVAAAGGNEKKAKLDVSFAAPSSTWSEFVDAKGLTGWSLVTKDKHFTFEDPRATTADPAGSKFCTQEWLEALEQAKEIFLSNQQQSRTASYSADSILNGSSMPSSADSLGGDTVPPLAGPHHLRQTLRKEAGDTSALDKGRKRFSKRHSKSGLAAVF